MAIRIKSLSVSESGQFSQCDDLLGYVGEHNATAITATIPQSIAELWLYIDFKLPDGSTEKTPRITPTVNVVDYNIPAPIVAAAGDVFMQLVALSNADGDPVWKSASKKWRVASSVNATTEIETDHSNFVTDAQRILDQTGAAASNANAKATLANTAANAANAAAQNADSKATAAQTAADLANQKAALANAAAENADAKASLADSAATLANGKAAEAESKGNAAEVKGNDAQTKGNAAQTAADLANSKAALADTSAANADTKATLADEKAALADSKATEAEQKGNAAENKGNAAESKGNTAQQQGNTAETKGNAAQTAADNANAIKNELQQKLDNGEFVGPQGKSYNPRGAWVSGGSYTNSNITIDVVSHNSISYYCKVTHTGVSTTPDADSTNWGVLAAAGIDNNKMLVNPSAPVIQGHTKQFTGYGSVSAPNNAKGKVEAVLKGVTRTNLITNSGMTVDVNANGIADSFNFSNSIGATFAINENAQKISINTSAVNSSNASVMQGNYGSTAPIPCSAGEVVSSRIECKFIKTAGAPYASLTMVFRNSTGGTLAAYAVDVTASTSGYSELKIENKTAPANTAFVSTSALLYTSATASTTPETADVWFKNAMLEKAATVGNYIASGTKHAGQVRVKSVGKNKINLARAVSRIGIATSTNGPTSATTKSLRVNCDLILGMSADGWTKEGAINNGATENALKFISPALAAYGAFIKVDPRSLNLGKTYKLSLTTNNTNMAHWLMYCESDGSVSGYQVIGGMTAGEFTLTRKTDILFIGFVSNLVTQTFDITNLQLEETIVTPHEPYRERIVYPLAAPGKSVPAASDETNVLSKKKTQRAQEYTMQSAQVLSIYTGFTNIDTVRVTGATGIVISTSLTNTVAIPNWIQTSPDAYGDSTSFIGKYYVGAEGDIRFIVAKGTYANLAAAQAALTGTVIRYQLATPIVTDIQVIGDLEVYPNGTVYTEPTIAGRTNTAVTVITDASRPIKSIRSVKRYDYTAGDIVMTDVTGNASITGSNTSITIASFDPTKWYFYDCEVDSQYDTNPQIVLNCEVDGGIVTHDYGATATAWTLTANESKAEYFLLTNAGGAANMVMMPVDGFPKIVKNTSGQTITLKTASSTGVAIENGFTVKIVYNGSDYEIVSRFGNTGWVAPTLLNGASGALYYRKNQANRLEFKGNITCATAASASFTLSASFYPVDHAYINVLSDDNTAGKIVLFNSGTFYIVSAGLVGKKINMDNISIPLG